MWPNNRLVGNGSNERRAALPTKLMMATREQMTMMMMSGTWTTGLLQIIMTRTVSDESYYKNDPIQESSVKVSAFRMDDPRMNK